MAGLTRPPVAPIFRQSTKTRGGAFRGPVAGPIGRVALDRRVGRRCLLVITGAALIGLPRAGYAQQPRRVGFLRLAPIDATQIEEFRAGLKETGYDEGRNLVIEYRYADGDYARLPELAADLVRQNVEVI